ncbi:SGNH/GDSL hydrolase family protein [Nocardia sp. NPDC051750]|uniref:SGNH/GDSL hydrolase family protein n=1 Tax=Nocardia sp. NPDC051750 TaxID=3364325 RepID=UPI0037A7CDBA
MIFRPAAAVPAFACALMVTAPAVGHAEPPVAGRYVAMGSSYAAGPGIEPVQGAGCARSDRNYAHQVADATGFTLTDVTCSGATTANLLSEPRQISGGGTAAPQIDAVTEDTGLVTITIGGNDLGLIGGMLASSCGSIAGRALPAAPPDEVTGQLNTLCGRAATTEPSSADIERVTQALTDIVRAVQDKAPGATVLLVEYLPVLAPAAHTCPEAPLAPEDATATRRTYDALIAATRRAAADTGVDSLAVPGADTHTACSPGPWVNGLIAPAPGAALPDLMSAVGSSYHPNLAGMSAVAQQVTAAVRR